MAHLALFVCESCLFWLVIIFSSFEVLRILQLGKYIMHYVVVLVKCR